MTLHAELVVRRGGFSLDVVLDVPAGQTLAVLGPNGAGKTTIVAALAGLLPLAAGRVHLGERVLEDVGAGVRVSASQRRVGVVFQDLRLFPALSVRDNVAYGLRASGRRRRDARAAAETALSGVQAADLADRRPVSLSGGQAQRVALARALVVRPDLLLLDEPLAALDVRARGAARALLRRTLEELACPRLLVTHDPLEALALAERLVVVEGGRVVQAGSVREVLLRPRSAFAAALAGLNLVRGRVAREGRQFLVRAPEGALSVADPGLPIGTHVIATVHPRSVVLHRAEPSGSPRNVLPGAVSDVELVGDRARVRLDTAPPLVAEVTAAAVVDLALAPGERVWASVKATEVNVEPD